MLSVTTGLELSRAPGMTLCNDGGCVAFLFHNIVLEGRWLPGKRKLILKIRKNSHLKRCTEQEELGVFVVLELWKRVTAEVKVSIMKQWFLESFHSSPRQPPLNFYSLCSSLWDQNAPICRCSSKLNTPYTFLLLDRTNKTMLPV